MHSASRSSSAAPGGSARRCVISDENGNQLTTALVRWAGGRRLAVESAGSRAALLGYYFVKGGRAVLVESDPFALRGRLATRWQRGRRLWWIEPATPRLEHDIPAATDAAS